MLADQSLVIIDSDSLSRKAIQATLDPFSERVKVVGAVADFRDGLKIIEGETPSIVILEARDLDRGMEEVEHILSNYPEVSVFVTAQEKNPDWILRLIRAGAAEYLTKPVVAEELTEAIRKVTRSRTQRSSSPQKRGAIVCAYNPCAGMGTTTVAVNTAAALAGQGKKVALVDLNLINGDVPSFLDLAPRYTLGTLTGKREDLDAAFLRSVLVQHSCGVHVLGSPKELKEGSRVTPELVKQVLKVLRSMFDYTVVDCAGALFDCNLTAFSCSDHVLFTTVLTIPALNNGRRYLMAMEEEGVGEDRVKLVVNRYMPKDDIRIADAEKVLETKAYATLPNSFADVRASINKGVPLVVLAPRSPVARAIDELVTRMNVETKQYALQERTT